MLLADNPVIDPGSKCCATTVYSPIELPIEEYVAFLTKNPLRLQMFSARLSRHDAALPYAQE